ncbi:hypothetical protein [Rhodospirillum sp. A1_3_36]|uniref:hypothetical protein n=1 Tax=Rhodospirillum sp. A1_3_36 TaxID=3391666 RepID=UPI0039A59D3D
MPIEPNSPKANETKDDLAIPSGGRRRDDFNAKVKSLLAQRAGYLCSNPECRRQTIGPRKGERGTINIGVAAHIKAASPGGPRYDHNQTQLERTSEDNGIWLCANHAHQIDHDSNEFAVEKLKQWKEGAEEHAFQQIANGRGVAITPQLAAELLRQHIPHIPGLGLSSDAGLEAVKPQVLVAAQEDINAYMRRKNWPDYAVELGLQCETNSASYSLTQSCFSQVLDVARHVVLVSEPGTGKSTTLIQAASKLIAGGQVPAFVPLSVWSESGADLFSWLLGTCQREWDTDPPSLGSFRL